MTDEQKKKLEQQLWNIADELRGRMNAGQKIGYINRIQSASFFNLVNNCEVSASVNHRNGTPERPIVYIFVSFKGK